MREGIESQIDALKRARSTNIVARDAAEGAVAKEIDEAAAFSEAGDESRSRTC
jgi:hypothetical protein